MSSRFDYQNQICRAQAFTGAATVSAHSYQKQSAAQDLSIGRRMSILVLPTVDAGAGSTVLLEAVQADVTALTTNIEVLSSISVAAADFVVGKEFEVPFPLASMDRLHLGLRVTITGGTTTATLDAYIVPSDEIAGAYKSFPKVVDAEVG